jgi:hypothetical protein
MMSNLIEASTELRLPFEEKGAMRYGGALSQPEHELQGAALAPAEAAKLPGAPVPGLEHFLALVPSCLHAGQPAISPHRVPGGTEESA